MQIDLPFLPPSVNACYATDWKTKRRFKSKEYKEAKEPTEGNLFWFGLALRDSDIELLKAKPCVINRYPLMDVSIIEILLAPFSYLALCEEEYLLRYYISFATFLLE